LQIVADEIASAVNGMNTVNANTSLLMTFDKDKQGRYLKQVVGGDSYELVLTPNFVIVRQGAATKTSHFIEAVHLWPPAGLTTTTETYLSDMDAQHYKLAISSGYDFVIERRLLFVDYLPEYHTFVYLAQ
jgi:hypothetical protein